MTAAFVSLLSLFLPPLCAARAGLGCSDNPRERDLGIFRRDGRGETTHGTTLLKTITEGGSHSYTLARKATLLQEQNRKRPVLVKIPRQSAEEYLPQLEPEC